MPEPREAPHEGAHPASAIGGLADDHPLTKYSCQQSGQGVTHGVVHRPLQADAMGARNPVPPILTNGLQSATSRRSTRAAMVRRPRGQSFVQRVSCNTERYLTPQTNLSAIGSVFGRVVSMIAALTFRDRFAAY